MSSNPIIQYWPNMEIEVGAGNGRITPGDASAVGKPRAKNITCQQPITRNDH